MRKRYYYPTEEQITTGNAYITEISWESDYSGEVYRIYEEENELCWKFGTVPKRSPHSLLNLLNRPIFVVSNPDGEEMLQIRRSNLFIPSFEIIEGGNSVGRIRMASVLRNKFSVDITGLGSWLIHMPLFTIYFGGYTSEGTNLWIAVGPSKRQWNILLEPNMDNFRLLASLSFIHRQWWCFG